jgi:hypothetical protein
MNSDQIFSRLWLDYIRKNPSAGKIHDLFLREGEEIVNDHIAFRTLDFPEIDIDVLSRLFTINGYIYKGEYHFEDKHLYARHFESASDKNAPRIFISQLILSQCSPDLQQIMTSEFKKTEKERYKTEDLIFLGTLFKPLSYEIYKSLLAESEYAAWFYVWGFRANHFTVSINSLKKHNTIQSVNELLKNNGYPLNIAGGEIKGTKEDLLQQSSTLADKVPVKFSEGTYEIPCCYYEFAQRYPDSGGKLYSGFVAKSADKIFESTNVFRK